jgi:IclR family pca regulon transcriptional regulator
MSKRALRAELEQVRSDGYAVNDEELAEGLYSISVPVHGKTGEVVAAVNMAAHALMISLDELVDRLLPLLISTAGQISARLGYRGVGEKRRGA